MNRLAVILLMLRAITIATTISMLRWRELSQDVAKFNSYLDEWIYGVRDRCEYIERMGVAYDAS